MQLSDGRHFSYCLNVHPGESFEDLLHAIETYVPEIKNALSPDQPFGLGLRIAKEASVELKNSEKLQQLKACMEAQDCYAFTINGFPFGAFHQTRVKEHVYQPDWSSPERLDYSKDLFDHLAFLLPEGGEGSVSTVPLGYKFSEAKPSFTAYSKHLSEMALHLHHIEQETGKLVHLGLEPEPDCVLETTAETLAFFKEQLFTSGLASEKILRRHIGVCLDTCHVAMQFEDPIEAVKAFTEAGIRISKTQISAALECEAANDLTGLKAFDDGVYLHQVKSQNGKAWRDLPDFISDDSCRLVASAPTLRIHAHVPLHWEGDQDFRSTRHTLTPEFWKALAQSDCTHLEVETYTFDVLPESIRAGRTVAQDMIAECQWALPNIDIPLAIS